MRRTGMRVVLSIQKGRDGFYRAHFTIHQYRTAPSPWPPVSFAETFPDQISALERSLDAIQTHMLKRFDLEPDEYRVEIE